MTLGDGDLLPPITVVCSNEQTAVSLVMGCSIAAGASKVEVIGFRDDVMKAAYGEPSQGTVSIRSDWIWSGDNPIAKLY